jgi:hypothetical protein
MARPELVDRTIASALLCWLCLLEFYEFLVNIVVGVGFML